MRRTISLLLSICVLVSFCACGHGSIDFDGTVSTMVLSPAETIPSPDAPEVETFDVKLSFAGDTLLASFKDETTYLSFNQYADEKPPTYFLEKVRHIFEADDFTVVNLENVFTDQDLPTVEKDHDPAYWYKSRTSNVEILTSSSVEAVSLVNNHTEDYGAAGFEDTVKTVRDAGLYYGTANETMYLEKDGFTVAVICTGLWSGYQTAYVQSRLDAAKENSDYQVIFFHGGTELIHQPEEWKIGACRELADGGADLIIGSHPHILQPMENYNGVDIVYSLGNFCFGDWYRPENRTVIYQMNLTVSAETMEVLDEKSELIPCYVYTGDRNNYQPAVIEDEEEINQVISFMRGESDSPVREAGQPINGTRLVEDTR